MRGLRRRSAGRAHRRSAWTRGDSLALTAITLVAAGARAFRLTQPARGVFDEVYYVRDGCFYLRLSACRPGEELSPSHPPLGKWLIGVSIRIFGYRPGGWRVAPLVAGILTVALLYILARKLLGSTTGASIAAGLLAIDFLHLVQSRTAMLDVFVPLFVVAAFLCSVYDRERWLRADPASSGHRQRRLFDRRWRFLAGLAMGAAVSSKWSGLPILPALIALILSWEVAHRRAGGSVAPGREALREEVPSVLLALLVIPAAVYLTSYVGVVHGSVLAFPCSEGSWARAVVDRQVSMVRFQAGLGDAIHPYASPAWSWPLFKRPTAFYFSVSGGRYQEVLALGNPLVWGAGLLSLLLVGIQRLRGRTDAGSQGIILMGALASWAPWLALSPARRYMFLFYFLPTVPFLCLALAWVSVELWRGRVGRGLVAGFAAASVASFAFFYPILTGVPISPGAWKARILFTDCRIEQTVLAEGVPSGAPPQGWCWM